MPNVGFFPSGIQEISFFQINKLIPINCNNSFDWTVNNCLITNHLTQIDENYLSNYEFILAEFRQNYLLFGRHFVVKSDLEITYRHLALRCLSLSNSLKENSINSVLLSTAASHHVDSLILELACRISNIKQVFLYHVEFIDRLLPILQSNGISTRGVMNLRISEETFFSQVMDFNRYRQIQVKNSNKIFKRRDSFLYARFEILKKLIYVSGVKAFKYFSSLIASEKNEIGLDPWSFLHTKKVMLQQREANHVLKNFIRQDKLKLQSFENQACFVIYAHLEPESTHFPEGGDSANVIDLVLKIRSLGYKDHIIFKEHPAFQTYATNGDASRSGMARNLIFYETLRKLGCIFVDNDFTAGLNGLVVTLTGTVALERSLVGLETVVMGHIWFAGMPGCLTLSEAINRLNGRVGILSKEIELSSQKFLLETLNFHAIKNPTGIGSGIKSEDIETKNDYRLQIQRLVDYMSNL